MALAFEAPSLASPDLYASSVLQTLMGGGSSFVCRYSKQKKRETREKEREKRIMEKNVC